MKPTMTAFDYLIAIPFLVGLWFVACVVAAAFGG